MKTAQQLVEQAKTEIQEAEIAALKTQLTTPNAPVVIDVREPDEYAAGHLPQAINIPRGVLEFKITECITSLEPNSPMIVYCQTGGRSALAAQSLKNMGFEQVQSLQGGYEAWQQAQ